MGCGGRLRRGIDAQDPRNLDPMGLKALYLGRSGSMRGQGELKGPRPLGHSSVPMREQLLTPGQINILRDIKVQRLGTQVVCGGIERSKFIGSSIR